MRQINAPNFGNGAIEVTLKDFDHLAEENSDRSLNIAMLSLDITGLTQINVRELVKLSRCSISFSDCFLSCL